jgi:hypothetical protein
MRKVLLAAVFAAASFSGLYAQKLKDLDDVQEKFSKGKYDEAKEKIDKILEDAKNQSIPNVWYWKGNVYSQLAKKDSANQLSYDAAHEAFLAYQKYQQLDPKNVMMTLDQNVGLFILRDTYANKGDFFWNKKDYATAFDNYKKALGVEEYIKQKGFSYNNFKYPVLDTALVRFAASAAFTAKKQDEAIPYFEQLADAKIAEKDYKDIYGLLVQYYQKKGNNEKADKYLALGQQLFPDQDYWVGIELGESGNDKAKRMDRLGELLAKYPNNASLAMDYAIELRNYTYIYDTKPADYEARQAKFEDALKKALVLDPNSTIGWYLLSEHYYIQVSDLEEAARNIKGTTPADAAKRKAAIAKINTKYEDLANASQKAYDLFDKQATLKIQDKANFRKVINQLVDYYTRKKQTDKVATLEAKLKTL